MLVGAAQSYTLARMTDPALIRETLNVDRGSNAYMIGDLSGSYWQGAEFYGAWPLQTHGVKFGKKKRPVAIVLVYMPIDPPPVITWGDPEAIRALLGGLLDNSLRDTRLDKIVYHAAPEHMIALQSLLDVTATLTMWRMIVTPEHFGTPSQISTARRLTGSDAPAMRAVFESGAPGDLPPGTFNLASISPGLLESGLFYGVAVNGVLASVAGTHIISAQEGIGVVGYVFTHLDARGNGYATACTGAVTQALFAQGIEMVALNVREDNPPAIRAYEKLGFVRHAPLYEGTAQRKTLR